MREAQDPNEIEPDKKALLEYCRMDTLGSERGRLHRLCRNLIQDLPSNGTAGFPQMSRVLMGRRRSFGKTRLTSVPFLGILRISTCP